MAFNSGVFRNVTTGLIQGRPIADRLWGRVWQRDSVACWPWPGRCFGNGYGLVSYKGRPSLTHRVAYELTHGAIPRGLVIRHTCDRRACCNPQHLVAGTQKENLADMDAKGRRRNVPSFGEKNGSAKLTAKNVLDIRKAYVPRVVTQISIAARFGVSLPLVEKILAGKLWKTEEAGYGVLGWARTENERPGAYTRADLAAADARADTLLAKMVIE